MLKEANQEEENIPQITLYYEIQKPLLEELEDQELVNMFSMYWKYLIFMNKNYGDLSSSTNNP